LVAKLNPTYYIKYPLSILQIKQVSITQPAMKLIGNTAVICSQIKEAEKAFVLLVFINWFSIV